MTTRSGHQETGANAHDAAQPRAPLGGALPGTPRNHPRNPPKPRLTPERIVAAAIEVADAEGLTALTMRRLADILGFTTMSLYRHVRTKDELVGLMAEAAYGEQPAIDTAGGWRNRLRSLARSDWELYHRHPWLLQISETRPAFGPNVLAAYEAALAAIAETGLGATDMTAALSLLNHFVRGSAQDSLAEIRAEAETGVDYEQWWSERLPALTHRVTPGRHPTLAWVAAQREHSSPEHRFTFGLTRICDGIQALIDTGSDGQAAAGVGSAATVSDGAWQCAVCGARTAQAPTGRRRDYCSPACRQRAYRDRTSRPGAESARG